VAENEAYFRRNHHVRVLEETIDSRGCRFLEGLRDVESYEVIRDAR
jgi:hypothetical protein